MKTMRVLRDERGNILAMAALSMTLLFSFLAFGVDVGNLYYTQRQLQTLADAAAMAGALEITSCGGTASSSSCAVMQKAASTAITESGYAAPTLFEQCAAASGTGLLLTINNGPCAVAGDPNSWEANYVEAVVSEIVPTYFAFIFGVKTLQISARAEAGKALPGYPPCDLNLGGIGQDITENGGSSISNAAGANCEVVSDSNSPGTCTGGTPSAMIDGSITTSALVAAGGICENGGSTVPSNTQQNASAVPNPFASLVPPTTGSLTNRGSVGPLGSTTTLSPGYYPNGLTTNGGTYTVNFSAGTYYFGNNVIFSNTVGSGNSVTGSGVTFIFAPNAQLTLNSGVTFGVSAPSVSALANGALTNGAYNGILIWEPGTTGDTSDNFILDANTNSTLNGAVYAPNGQVQINGSATVNANGSIVSYSLNNNAKLVLGCSGMPNGCPGGGGGAGGGAMINVLAE